MSRTPEQTCERAAEILLREAIAIRDSCELGGKEWACDDCTGECKSRADHAEMIELAVELRRPAAIDMELERAGRAI